MISDLPVVRAVAKAYVQHERWLASIGTGGVLGKTHPERHPMAGIGADSRDVASVYLHGETENAWWQRKMYAHGIDTFMQLPFDEGRKLQNGWLAEMPLVSRSEMMKVIHILKRAEKLGLVMCTRAYGRLWWGVA